MANITVDERRCKGCGYCVAFCPMAVYEMGSNDQPVIRQAEKCTNCQMCVKRCPDFAIHVEER